MNSEPLSESIPSTGNGNLPESSTRATNTHFWALVRTPAVSVQPVWMSETVRVWQKSPEGFSALVADAVDLDEPRRVPVRLRDCLPLLHRKIGRASCRERV